MSDNLEKGKKRKKSYYHHGWKKYKKQSVLDAGMKGFLITCNNREKQAVREAYNVLNEYADVLYGHEQEPKEKDAASVSGDEEEDIEDALKKEVTALQDATSKSAERRFQVVESGANNCLFIKTVVDDPCQLVHTIFTDTEQTGKQKARFIMRLLPVSVTCKASIEMISKVAEQVLKPHFNKPEGSTYSIQLKVRNNNTLGRNVLIPLIAQIVQDLHPSNRVNLTNSELTIIVEIVRTVCCISVVKDYFKFRKYNLLELVMQTKKNKPDNNEDNKLAEVGQNDQTALNMEQSSSVVPESNQDLPSTDDVKLEETAAIEDKLDHADVKEQSLDKNDSSDTQK